MNTELRKRAKTVSKKTFFKLINNSVLENAWKQGDVKLVKTEKKRNYLVSEPNYLDTKFFTEYLLAIKMKKIKHS